MSAETSFSIDLTTGGEPILLEFPPGKRTRVSLRAVRNRSGQGTSVKVRIHSIESEDFKEIPVLPNVLR